MILTSESLAVAITNRKRVANIITSIAFGKGAANVRDSGSELVFCSSIGNHH
jgi:hypothetical protein